ELGLPHEHLQFGTGTVDPLLGLDVSRVVGAGITLAAFAQGQAPLYADGYGYQAGTRLLGGGEAQRAFGDVSVRLGAAVAHEFPGGGDGGVPRDDGNRGRSDFCLGAGATMPLGQDWSVSADLRARAWGQVVGAQLDLPLVAEISVGRLWHFESTPEADED